MRLSVLVPKLRLNRAVPGFELTTARFPPRALNSRTAGPAGRPWIAPLWR